MPFLIQKHPEVQLERDCMDRFADCMGIGWTMLDSPVKHQEMSMMPGTFELTGVPNAPPTPREELATQKYFSWKGR